MGYYSGEIHKEMYDRNIKTYIPINDNGRSKNKENNYYFTSYNFKYDENNDIFICPNNKCLTRKSYRIYKGIVGFASKSSDCNKCMYKLKCIKTNCGKINKTIEKVYSFAYTIKQNFNFGTTQYYEAMRLRRIFAYQKANNNFVNYNNKLNTLLE